MSQQHILRSVSGFHCRYPVLVVLKLDVLGKDGQRGSPTNVDTIDIGAPLNSGSEAAQGSGAGPQGGSGPNQNGGMGPGSNAYGPPGQGTPSHGSLVEEACQRRLI